MHLKHTRRSEPPTKSRTSRRHAATARSSGACSFTHCMHRALQLFAPTRRHAGCTRLTAVTGMSADLNGIDSALTQLLGARIPWVVITAWRRRSNARVTMGWRRTPVRGLLRSHRLDGKGSGARASLGVRIESVSG